MTLALPRRAIEVAVLSTPFLRHAELDRESVTDWNAHPFDLPAIAGLGRLEFRRPVTFLVGENGSGKSTLLEAIAVRAGFHPAGGTKHFQSGERPTESPLRDHLRLARGARRESSGFFLRAETLFNVATEAEDYVQYGWPRLHRMSHGEAFLWVAVHKFRDGGLFLLDEPEAALSPQRQLSLLVRMHELVRAGSQFIISTHSPLLLAFPEATLYLLDPSGIHETRYEDTEHYTVTRAFLQDPAHRLRQLFAEPDDAV